MNIIINIISVYSKIILFYFFIISMFYIILILLSSRKLRSFVKVINNDVTIISNYTKPISVVVPAYNEESTIIDNITSLLELNYPEFEIIIVNDGSKDKTLESVIDHFELRKIDVEINMQVDCKEIKAVYGSFILPNLVVVNKENGGKADALNAGVNLSRYPLFCGIDADCIIEKDALLRIVKPFLKYEDTIAVGGIVRIANGCTIKDGKLLQAKLPKQAIVRFQIIEYFRAFLTSRIGWERINALLIISGAFGVFKKSAVVKIGGYSKTIGEDMELTMKMHEYYRTNKLKYKIDFASDAVCWTQVPDTLKGLRSQRIRWHRGLTDSILRHKKMMFNPSYGTVGILSMPYFVLVEMLGPVIEMVGYVILIISIITGTLSKFFIFVFLMAFLYGILFSLSAILFEEFSYKRYSGFKEITKLVIYSFFEQIVYRQITVWWRVISFLNFKNGSKEWGTIKRKSFYTKEG
ncbi:glycosyltransferase [Clostridium sp.]|uniref:glycosyltransferase family 2 protein n=1 Tax=Clostridium sp. TaxID=1506 RepID=UPI001A4BEA22|nr:glycosyltransferase [Clostridium sp.]MBK5241553.1 glycosyltransferase family 2 protein [Clostridium sp.]